MGEHNVMIMLVLYPFRSTFQVPIDNLVGIQNQTYEVGTCWGSVEEWALLLGLIWFSPFLNGLQLYVFYYLKIYTSDIEGGVSKGWLVADVAKSEWLTMYEVMWKKI